MQTLFEVNNKIRKSEKEKSLKKEITNSEYSKDYFIKQILTEEYLWDMRCWDKPKKDYSKEEVIKQLKKWLQKDTWLCNCGHTLFCIEKLLLYKWMGIDEIADLVIQNNKVKYQDEIGTW